MQKIDDTHDTEFNSLGTKETVVGVPQVIPPSVLVMALPSPSPATQKVVDAGHDSDERAW